MAEQTVAGDKVVTNTIKALAKDAEQKTGKPTNKKGVAQKD